MAAAILGQCAMLETIQGYHAKFSAPVKAGTLAAFGLFTESPRRYENCKDDPHLDFYGLTPRQAYIEHAEQYMKILYGQDIYGRILGRRLLKIMHTAQEEQVHHVFVISDSGFMPEFNALINSLKPTNVLLIKLSREGKDFATDSRGYIQPEGVDCLEFANNGTLVDVKIWASTYFYPWLCNALSK